MTSLRGGRLMCGAGGFVVCLHVCGKHNQHMYADVVVVVLACVQPLFLAMIVCYEFSGVLHFTCVYTL